MERTEERKSELIFFKVWDSFTYFLENYGTGKKIKKKDKKEKEQFQVKEKKGEKLKFNWRWTLMTEYYNESVNCLILEMEIIVSNETKWKSKYYLSSCVSHSTMHLWNKNLCSELHLRSQKVAWIAMKNYFLSY